MSDKMLDASLAASNEERNDWYRNCLAEQARAVAAERALSAANAELERRITDACRLLIDGLPPDGQRRVVQALADEVCPIVTPRAGGVLNAIAKWMPMHASWDVEQAKQAVAAAGVEADVKEVYNALGYLTRKGRVRRIGYGQYMIGDRHC